MAIMLPSKPMLLVLESSFTPPKLRFTPPFCPFYTAKLQFTPPHTHLSWQHPGRLSASFQTVSSDSAVLFADSFPSVLTMWGHSVFLHVHVRMYVTYRIVFAFLDVHNTPRKLDINFRGADHFDTRSIKPSIYL